MSDGIRASTARAALLAALALLPVLGCDALDADPTTPEEHDARVATPSPSSTVTPDASPAADRDACLSALGGDPADPSTADAYACEELLDADPDKAADLAEARASDDFLEFAEPRRARKHPRFDHTHGQIGLYAVPNDNLGVDEGDWGRPLNRLEVASAFLLPFRDGLLVDNVNPASLAQIPDVGGSYVSRIPREQADHRQLLIAVAFYQVNTGHRARVGMSAADVNVANPGEREVNLRVIEFDHQVAEASVGDSWDEAYDNKIYEPVGAWLERHR